MLPFAGQAKSGSRHACPAGQAECITEILDSTYDQSLVSMTKILTRSGCWFASSVQPIKEDASPYDTILW